MVCAPLLYVALATGRLRPAAGVLAAGAAIGLLVAAGWFATGYLGDDDFSPAPVASLTFVAPAADTLQYVMLSTGLQLNFGIVLVAGIVVGSLVTALVTRRFRLEGFVSARHMLRSLTGAALMGAGGAMAYGCTVGQGLTGVSTLALPSFIAVVGYMGGVWVGLRGPIRVPALSRRSRPPRTTIVRRIDSLRSSRAGGDPASRIPNTSTLGPRFAGTSGERNRDATPRSACARC